MKRQRLILLLINILGGGVVVRSYFLGIEGGTSGAILWGGVPESVRPVYYASMIISAVGYLAILYFLLVRALPDETIISGRFGYSLFYPIFLFILIPSAFWMPLANLYASEPTPGVWIAIRVVLAVVGLAAIALTWALLALRPRNRGVSYWAAVVGAGYFAFHTFILDAIVWASLFRD